MRKIFKIFYTLFAIIIFIVGILYFLVATHSGLKLAWYLGSKFIPGNISVQSIKGTLSNLTLQDFKYTDGSTQFSIKSFYLNWDLSALLHKRVIIHDIQAEDLIVKLPQSSEHNKSSPVDIQSILYWFSRLQIDNAKISNFNLFNNDASVFNFKKFIIAPISSSSQYWLFDSPLGQGKAKLHVLGEEIDIEDVDFHYSDAVIKMTGVINHSWDFKWTIDIPHLNHIYSPSHGSIYSSGKVKGKLDQPEVTARINAHNLAFESLKIRSLEADIHEQFGLGIKNEANVRRH